MGRIFIANNSTAAATDGRIGVQCPLVGNTGRRRIYLHEITLSPRGADWAADVQIYVGDTYEPVELVLNGAFATDTIWTKGTSWTIADDKASKAVDETTALSQEITGAVAGEVHELVYTLTETASGITPSWAGFTYTADAGTGTHTELGLAASAEATLAFTADATAIVDVSAVSLKKVASTLSTEYLLHDSIRSGTTDQYIRTFPVKQPWSDKGFSLYVTSGGASCIIDMTMVYEVV